MADIAESVSRSLAAGFQFISVPLVHPRFKRNLRASRRPVPLTRSDVTLSGSTWSSTVVGRVSPWLRFDAAAQAVRANAEDCFKQELMWASHLCLQVVSVAPRGPKFSNFARVLASATQTARRVQIWVDIPLVPPAPPSCVGGVETKLAVSAPSWDAWRRIRTACEGDSRVGVCLRMGECLPSDGSVLSRWSAERICAIVVPTDIFVPSGRDRSPRLTPDHEAALRKLAGPTTRLVVSGPSRYENGHELYIDALSRVWTSGEGGGGGSAGIAAGMAAYRDFLQVPLQPLMDNLQSQTYEVFEKDPVKYAQYEAAIRAALAERHRDEKPVCVMVVGAGRGPLVRCALRAAESLGKTLRVYAVEKNPNALVTLRNACRGEWKGRGVTVVGADMREWKAPEKADIMVSELLGSFADNELSPECLSGAQWAIKRDGISIPASSASYLAPITTSKLWSDLALQKTASAFETPYVVQLAQFHTIAPPRRCFQFQHPDPAPMPHDHRRAARLRFAPARAAATLHGFAGYFDATLYGKTTISIHPDTHSKGMFSWFPIFFPLRSPVHVRRGGVVVVDIWRCADKKRVWYEWALVSPAQSPLHNSAGRSYFIGL